MKVDTYTPDDLFTPIGPYSHMTKAGPFITISGTPGVDPRSGQMAGPDAYTQTARILQTFRSLLEHAGAGFKQVMHVNVFLKNVDDFDDMNRAYREAFVDHLPARTVICVADLPKRDARLTMNLTAVVADPGPSA